LQRLPSNEVSFIDAPVAKRWGMIARYLSLEIPRLGISEDFYFDDIAGIEGEDLSHVHRGDEL
jgi:hypothetical protein